MFGCNGGQLRTANMTCSIRPMQSLKHRHMGLQPTCSVSADLIAAVDGLAWLGTALVDFTELVSGWPAFGSSLEAESRAPENKLRRRWLSSCPIRPACTCAMRRSLGPGRAVDRLMLQNIHKGLCTHSPLWCASAWVTRASSGLRPMRRSFFTITTVR